MKRLQIIYQLLNKWSSASTPKRLEVLPENQQYFLVSRHTFKNWRYRQMTDGKKLEKNVVQITDTSTTWLQHSMQLVDYRELPQNLTQKILVTLHTKWGTITGGHLKQNIYKAFSFKGLSQWLGDNSRSELHGVRFISRKGWFKNSML